MAVLKSYHHSVENVRNPVHATDSSNDQTQEKI